MLEQIRGSCSLTQIAGDYLLGRESHWAERDAALQRCGELLEEGALNPVDDDFSTSLKSLVAGLVAQLPDLRSQVVRSACNTLALLAAEMCDHAALERLMCKSVLPAVIALISNGNKVLATAGRDCLPILFMYCHFDSMLKVLASSLVEARHVAVRHSCCVCLLHALKYWPVQVLSSMAGLLERTLVPTATDAAVEVRQRPDTIALAFRSR